jgi:hypothetical protein
MGNVFAGIFMKNFYKCLGIILCLTMAYANSIGWSISQTFTTGGIAHRGAARTYHK